jgi:dephospho-CoA kinase
MQRIGLTGGIGCGKSTAATWLASKGVPVIDTDDIARRLVEPGEPALDRIRARFGNGILRHDGTLDRARLAALVFGDASARAHLEGILHPLIHARWLDELTTLEKQGHKRAVVVVPLLFEKGYQGLFDRVMAIVCSPGTQRERLIARGWTEQQIRERNAAQWTLDAKAHAASKVIWSEGRVASTQRQLGRVMAIPED